MSCGIRYGRLLLVLVLVSGCEIVEFDNTRFAIGKRIIIKCTASASEITTNICFLLESIIVFTVVKFHDGGSDLL